MFFLIESQKFIVTGQNDYSGSIHSFILTSQHNSSDTCPFHLSPPHHPPASGYRQKWKRRIQRTEDLETQKALSSSPLERKLHRKRKDLELRYPNSGKRGGGRHRETGEPTVLEGETQYVGKVSYSYMTDIS